MLNGYYYSAAFPLHDGAADPEDPETDYDTHEGTRSKLFQYWGRMRMMFKKQPFDLVRSYFGEKIGLCFDHLADQCCMHLLMNAPPPSPPKAFILSGSASTLAG